MAVSKGLMAPTVEGGPAAAPAPRPAEIVEVWPSASSRESEYPDCAITLWPLLQAALGASRRLGSSHRQEASKGVAAPSIDPPSIAAMQAAGARAGAATRHCNAGRVW